MSKHDIVRKKSCLQSNNDERIFQSKPNKAQTSIVAIIVFKMHQTIEVRKKVNYLELERI